MYKLHVWSLGLESKKTNWKQNVLNKKNNTFIYDEHTVVVDVKALAVKTFHKSREKKDMICFFFFGLWVWTDLKGQRHGSRRTHR